jgi:hypothetical protein
MRDDLQSLYLGRRRFVSKELEPFTFSGARGFEESHHDRFQGSFLAGVPRIVPVCLLFASMRLVGQTPT